MARLLSANPVPPFTGHTPSYSVIAGSTGNIDISSAPATVDGVSLSALDRVLLKDQTSPNEKENGVYVFNSAGSALTRAPDFDQDIEFEYGAKVYVREGTVNADSEWTLTSDNVVVGTDDIVFQQLTEPFKKNTIYVDSTYGSDASGTRGRPDKPFATIGAAIAASSADDKIVVSPGSYAESLTLSHDLFFDAPGVAGLTSIDIASGSVYGRIGKIEYHANGAVIHPDSNDTDNWDCLKFAFAVGATQTESWSVGLLYGVYDAGATDFIDFNTAGYSVLNLYGIGQKAAEIKNSLNTGLGVFRNLRTNSLKNLHFNNTFSNMTFQYSSTGGSNTGDIDDVSCNGECTLGSATGTYDGEVHNLLATTQISCITTGTSSGDLVDISTGTGSLRLGNFSGFARVTGGSVNIGVSNTGVITGLIKVADGVSVDVASNSVDMTNGLIICDRTTSSLLSSGFDTISKVRGAAAGLWMLGSNALAVLKGGSFLEECSANAVARNGSVIESGAIIRRCLVDLRNNTTHYEATAQEFAGTLENSVIDLDDTHNGFAVSDGAIISGSTFKGKTSAAADRYKPCIIGRNLLGEWFTTGGVTWDDTSKYLTWTLTGQPQESDGAGSHQGIASGTTFNAKIYSVTPAGAGDDISAVEGLFVLVEVFDNGGTWELRSNDAAIDTAIGGAGNKTPTGTAANNNVVCQEATITVSGTSFEGVPFGEEITVNRPDVVTATTTTYDVEGFEKYINYDDDTAAGAITSNLAPVSSGAQSVVHKKLGTTGNIVLTAPSGSTIDGAATYTLTAQNEAVSVYTDGTNYFVHA